VTTRIEPLRAGTLKRLIGSSPYFSRWEDQDYREAEPFVHLLSVAGGEVVMQMDDLPPYDYFLVNGAVELATSTLRRELRSDHVDAGYPVAHLRPSRYRVSAAGDARLVRFETSRLKRLAARPRAPRFRAELASTGGTWRGHPWVDDVEKKLATGLLPVPPLPTVALKVRQVLASDDVDAARLQRVIGADPAIAARLIRVTNSPSFRGQMPCDSLRNAIVRLGHGTVGALVTALGVKEIFGASQPALRQRLIAAWQHAVEIAALSTVLAKLTPGVASDRALLAGLLHDVGKVALLKTAAAFPDLEQKPGIVDEVLESIGPRASTLVMSSWGLPDDFKIAAEHAADWYYDADAGLQLVDLVIVAHLHALVRRKELDRLPRIDETPAFRKLALGNLSPQLSLLVLDESRTQIQELRAALL
jgi:HD-like signal output (HDOD) protein